MPLYSYECKNEHFFEAILPVVQCDKPMVCPYCTGETRKIIINGHGGIFRKSDAAPWVRDAAKVLTDDDERPNPNLQSVDDLRKYLSENPNVRPKESHPAFPSSYGDAFSSKPDLVQQAKERSRKGREKLRAMRSITLNSAG